MNVVEVHGVFKKYGKITALNNVSLNIRKGEVVLFVGKNGSGKSSLIKCILDHISFQGKIYRYENNIGYIPEKVNLPDFLTVYNFLKEISILRGSFEIELIEHLLSRYSLSSSRDKMLSSLSKGMRQKVLIIQSYLGNPHLFIFDEPLNGLDEQTRKIFIEDIKIAKKDRKTIIITTHHTDLYSISKKRVVIFENGAIYEKFKDD